MIKDIIIHISAGPHGQLPDTDSQDQDPNASPLDALDEPRSLVDLRQEVGERLPRVDLPDVLLEVDTWTGFTKAFNHCSLGEGHRLQWSKIVVDEIVRYEV